MKLLRTNLFRSSTPGFGFSDIKTTWRHACDTTTSSKKYPILFNLFQLYFYSAFNLILFFIFFFAWLIQLDCVGIKIIEVEATGTQDF